MKSEGVEEEYKAQIEVILSEKRMKRRSMSMAANTCVYGRTNRQSHPASTWLFSSPTMSESVA